MDDPGEEIRRALTRRAPVSDEDFDGLYPAELRPRSERHWTPVGVALRAATLLAPTPRERVLDVGSGVGKVCLVGALAFPASWYGIERDRAQVSVANDVARRLGVADETYFLRGELDSIEWRHFDGFYLFNPAGSILADPDVDPVRGHREAITIVEKIEAGLARTRPGARVVTYHGFGGRMPPEFEEVHHERLLGGDLRLWTRSLPRRRRPLDPSAFAA